MSFVDDAVKRVNLRVKENDALGYESSLHTK